jgi:LysM repeat protein
MRRLRILLPAGFFLLAACSPSAAQTAAPAAAWTLTPYATRTPAPSPLPPTPLATLPALPSPTPFLYTIQEGDTLSGIAEKFNLPLEDLMAANPGVVPSALSVGGEIRIPTGKEDLLGEPTPAPAPLLLRQTRCYPSADGGLWCFALFENPNDADAENITAEMTLLDPEGKTLDSQTLSLLLDVLPSGGALPVLAYFAPPLPAETSLRVQLRTATLLRAGDARYPSVTLRNVEILIAWDGRSADIRGDIVSDSPEDIPSLSIAAIAYDAEGGLVGAKCWKSDRSLRRDAPLPFSFRVYSAGGDIARVTLTAEAHR